MNIPNKAVRDSAPFRVAEYPPAFPRLVGEAAQGQAAIDKWYYDLRSVLLREREDLEKSVQDAANGADTGTTESRLDALEAAVTTLQLQVTNISAALSSTVSGLAAHIAATTVHGSNGDVAGMNDLVSALSANGFLTMNVNASGVTAVTFADNVHTAVVAATFQVGAGAYTWIVNLSDADRNVGDVLHFKMMLPASINPTIEIKDLASGIDLVSFTHDGTPGFWNIIFVFNSDLNWYVHASGVFEPI